MPFISIVEFIELCKYLREHPVIQAEMVEVKRHPGPPPSASPPDSGVETTRETNSPANVTELMTVLSGL